MEEGSQMSMNAFVKACEAYEANILMLKEKIGDLERKLAEQDMKIQAPIRNDNAFLLKLAAIRKYENCDIHKGHQVTQENVEKMIKKPIKKLKSFDLHGGQKLIPIESYDQVYINGHQIMFVNNELFNCKDNPFELLTYLRYFNIGKPKVGEILCNCSSKSKLVYGCFRNMGGIQGDVSDNYKITKAHLAVHTRFLEERISLVILLYCVPTQNPNNYQPELCSIIELDDLSNKEYIEKNFNVENLLE